MTQDPADLCDVVAYRVVAYEARDELIDPHRGFGPLRSRRSMRSARRPTSASSASVRSTSTPPRLATACPNADIWRPKYRRYHATRRLTALLRTLAAGIRDAVGTSRSMTASS